ncbi:hypothetical protein [Anaerotruncus colihominis]|uniref:hypothetical protein n=1 Tax=Anaerotruncus colihominis TaxID=169435 RepID=UPI001899F989|nr:hypothetical protein [Anaerotruncus colihominis]
MRVLALCGYGFVSAIMEQQDSYLDVQAAANITAIGICAAASAKENEAKVFISDFSNLVSTAFSTIAIID